MIRPVESDEAFRVTGRLVDLGGVPHADDVVDGRVHHQQRRTQVGQALIDGAMAQVLQQLGLDPKRPTADIDRRLAIPDPMKP